MQNFINFIKYNNAFTFIAALLFIATASTFAASPELRGDAINVVISQKQKILSLDNTKLIAQDFGKFDSKLQIREIKEDSENYYVKYSFRTFVIRDYVWQEDDAEKILSVSKSFLANRDLGLYTAQELGEVVDYNLSYLKETQEIEKKRGETNKVVAIEYGGLIGKFLDPKEKEFPGYQPVVEEKKIPALASENSSINATTNQNPSVIEPQSAAIAGAAAVIPEAVVIPDKETLRQMVQEAVREILENKTNAISSSGSSSSEAILSSGSSSSTASSSPSVADASSSLSSFPVESFGAASSATSEVSSLSSSSASSEMASSSSDSFSSSSASSSSLPAEASLSSAESNQSSSQESSGNYSEVSSSGSLPAEEADSSEPAP